MQKILTPGEIFDGIKIPKDLYLDPNFSSIDKVGPEKLSLVVDIFSDEFLAPKIGCQCKNQKLGFFIWASRAILRTDSRYKGFATVIYVRCLSCKRFAEHIEQDVFNQYHDKKNKESFSKNIENSINKELNSEISS